MPIASGTRGLPGVLGIPRRKFLRGKSFRSRPFSSINTTVSGVTKDSAGVALASCVVNLYRTPGDVFLQSTVSDASGDYRFNNPGSGPFYLVAYKAGTTDVAGTTVNTIVNDGATAAVAFGPSGISGLKLWLDGSDASYLYTTSALATLVSTDGDPVGGWKDKSGNSNNFLQATSGNRPTFKEIGKNGRSTVQFDAALAQYMSITMSLMSAHTVFIVVRSDRTTVGFETLITEIGDKGLWTHVTAVDGTFNALYSVGVEQASPSSPVSSWNLITFAQSSTGDRNAWKDGSNFYSVTAGTQFDITYDSLGGHGGSELLTGHIAEVIMYDTQLSTIDRVRVESYLQNKWGL